MLESGVTRYTEVQPLGAGHSGQVVQARDRQTNAFVAIKRLPRGSKIGKHVFYEIMNHRLLKHAHIIQFKDCYLTAGHLCIVMEYASGGNLRQFITRQNSLSENNVRWFFQQLIIAVQYCHKMGVANRDIKLENLLVDGTGEYPVLKVCDFGYSKHEEMNSAPKSTVGTPLYLAPEIFKKQANEIYDGKKSDIWSCGVVLYTVYFGHFPFIKREDINSIHRFQRISEKVCNSPLEFPEKVQIPDDLQDLLTKMLEKNPEQRITLAQIMEHKWFLAYLPEEALDMNNEVNRQEYEPEIREKIQRLVLEAMIPYSTENDEPNSYSVEPSDGTDSA